MLHRKEFKDIITKVVLSMQNLDWYVLADAGPKMLV
jgi:hypothetical protein